MNWYGNKSGPMHGTDTPAFLPPVMVEETGWDILVALYADGPNKLTLDRLGAVVSAPQPLLLAWLARLEARELIGAARDASTGELVALLTRNGRELLDNYLSATSELQVAAHD